MSQALEPEPIPITRDRTTRHYGWASASLLLCLAPVLLTVLEWALATLLLGRSPDPWGNDHPVLISPGFAILHYAVVVVVHTLYMTPFTLPFIWWKKAGSTPQANLIAAGCFVLPLASIFLLRDDPTGIARWWKP